MTTVRAEACCVPPLDDDTIDRVLEGLPDSAALTVQADGGPVAARFDLVDGAPVLTGAAVFWEALVVAGLNPMSLSCEVVDDDEDGDRP